MLKQTRRPWQLPRRDLHLVLREQSPWHQTGTVPEVLARTIERPLASLLKTRLQSSSPRRFQIVIGPRRVGKTTVLYQTVRSLLSAGIPAHRIHWLRMDHPLLMETDFGELVRRLCEHATQDEPVYVFVDELVYAEKWDLWLKTFYDDHWPVQLVGSASASAVLRHRRMESGVGRWEEQYLAPYLFGEFLDLVGRTVGIPEGDNLEETLKLCAVFKGPVPEAGVLRQRFLLTGGFPELLLASNWAGDDERTLLLHSQRVLRNDAVERAIYKDIPQAFGVNNPRMLERLLYVLAAQATGLLSPNNICRDLGLSQPTFEKYLSYLIHAYLVFTLPGYSGTESAVQRRGRKLYFVDGAIRNAALQLGLLPLSDAAELGLLYENLVAGHLHALCQQAQVRLYHWRSRDLEIDFVYDHPTHPLAFEIAASPRHRRDGIYAFVREYPRFQGRCFLVAPSVAATLPDQNDDNVGTLPLDSFLLAVSAQERRELAARLGVSLPMVN